MPTIISGDTGIDKIAAGAIEFADLPTGSVLQVVNATYGTQTSVSTNSWTDSGLTATITPKFTTSKILVLVCHTGVKKESSNTAMGSRLLRGATTILNFDGLSGFSNSSGQNAVATSATYLDSPATTSATTYKTQINSQANSATVVVNDYYTDRSTSTITLMEIAG